MKLNLKMEDMYEMLKSLKATNKNLLRNDLEMKFQ